MHQNKAAAPVLPISPTRRSVLWRIHFWAALLASPFTLVAVLTGILYIFTPQIEAIRHGWLDHVAAQGQPQPLDRSVDAAIAAAPAGWRLQAVFAPHAPTDSFKAVFTSPSAAQLGNGGNGGHAGHQDGGAAAAVVAAAPAPSLDAPPPAARSITLYVDPYTARVLGSLADEDRFGNWSKRLHSRLLQGEGWRWMIELAASAMMVMLLSGIALWWPASGNGSPALPRSGLRGRQGWKQWHAFLGVALGVITLAILLTGLTWSKYAGEQIRGARDALGQASPLAPRELMSSMSASAAPLGWQAAWNLARARAPDVAMQLTAPRDRHGLWRVAAADPGRPLRRFELLLDPYTGQVLYYAGWDQQTAFGKATAIGIPFHRGEFGWWNQAVLLLFGAGVLFSLVSGWVMYVKRRGAGAQALPRIKPGAWKACAKSLATPAILLCVLMPVLAVACAAIALIESALWLQASRLQRTLR